ncbi:MAG TPA: 2-hydroxychromene-2-carboxylate isomerase [Candidatus Eremiobacteraceae bacterium]|nr:2-hydroxychromene-2-carboxylate isomerase [Candidatus Eremiobacteraceae bacterium]
MKPGEREPDLEFWFDFASTYSYIAAMRIEDLCGKAGVKLVWMPFLLGPIFELQGWNDSPFNINERRGAYMWRDMERLTDKFGLPWVRPTAFPRGSTLPARVACSIADQPWCGDFIRAVFTANFGEDRDIGDAAVVLDVLRRLGLPADEIVARALEPDKRGRLRANTARAIELGIFGAPNCLVRGELFWGEESLEDAISWAARSENGA